MCAVFDAAAAIATEARRAFAVVNAIVDTGGGDAVPLKMQDIAAPFAAVALAAITVHALPADVGLGNSEAFGLGITCNPEIYGPRLWRQRQANIEGAGGGQ